MYVCVCVCMCVRVCVRHVHVHMSMGTHAYLCAVAGRREASSPWQQLAGYRPPLPPRGRRLSSGPRQKNQASESNG